MYGSARWLVLLIWLCAAGPALAEVWQAGRIGVESGEVVAAGDDLVVAAGPDARIVLDVPLSPGFSLDANPIVSLEFAGRPPVQVMLLWQRSDEPGKLYRYKFLPAGEARIAVDLRGQDGWRGEAAILQLRLRIAPGQQVGLRRFEVRARGLWEILRGLWRDWTEFPDWRSADINRHSGLRPGGEAPHPLPVFAALLFACLLLYGVVARRRATAGGAALVVLGAWLALDGLWQVQLWRHAFSAWEQFGGKTSRQKVMASDDAPYARLAWRSRKVIGDDRARVFVFGDGDWGSMLATYYLAPMNTYWDRHGAGPPVARYLRRGDFVLLLSPASGLDYTSTTGRLVFADGETVAVSARLFDRLGVLLEVR